MSDEAIAAEVARHWFGSGPFVAHQIFGGATNATFQVLVAGETYYLRRYRSLRSSIVLLIGGMKQRSVRTPKRSAS